MNKSGINALSCLKLVSFDTDDLKLLTAVYRVMYPDRQTEESNLTETTYKFGSFKIWSTKYESKMQPRGINSAKIIASWPASPSKRFFFFFISRHCPVLFYTFNQAWRGTCHALLCMCKMVFIPGGILFCKPN